MANNPLRRDRERDDIRELLIAQGAKLDLELVREYHRTFGLEEELEEMLREIDRSEPSTGSGRIRAAGERRSAGRSAADSADPPDPGSRRIREIPRRRAGATTRRISPT